MKPISGDGHVYIDDPRSTPPSSPFSTAEHPCAGSRKDAEGRRGRFSLNCPRKVCGRFSVFATPLRPFTIFGASNLKDISC